MYILSFSLIKLYYKNTIYSQLLSSKCFPLMIQFIYVEKYNRHYLLIIFEQNISGNISNHKLPIRERIRRKRKTRSFGFFSYTLPPRAISRLRWSLEIEFRRRTRGFLIRIWGFSRNIRPRTFGKTAGSGPTEFIRLCYMGKGTGAGRCGKRRRKRMVGETKRERRITTTDTKRKRETMETNWWQEGLRGIYRPTKTYDTCSCLCTGCSGYRSD